MFRAMRVIWRAFRIAQERIGHPESGAASAEREPVTFTDNAKRFPEILAVRR